MSRNAFRRVVVLAAVALTGLLAVQVAWFQRAYDLQRRQLSERVNLALRQSGHRLLALEGDSTTAIPPVRPAAGNAWELRLERGVNYDSLPGILHEAFSDHRIEGDYYVSVVDCTRGELALGYTAGAFLAGAEIPCGNRERTAGCYNLTVTLYDQPALLLREMGFWIASAGACLLVLAYFASSLFVLVREKRLSQMKKDFINNLTHELKTPIANIAVASEVLKNPATRFSAEKARDYAGIIHRENGRLAEQVERVLRMAYLEENKLELRRERLDLHALLEEILAAFAPRVQRRAGNLAFHPKAARPEVEADPFHLANVIYSLLDNADKYSPEAPAIAVETENTPHGLRLTVADRGVGIRREHRRHIFDKFYRAPTGDRHEVKGFGLGLSYARLIVEAHGGAITVENAEPNGSRFIVTL